MALPTPSDAHVDMPLTNILVAFTQAAMDFVAFQVFPPVPVQKQSGKYFIWNRQDFMRSEMRLRGPGAKAHRAGMRLATQNYSADVFALEFPIDDQLRSNADDPLDLERDVTEFLGQQALIKKEKEFASAHFTTGKWTGSTTGSDITPGTLWSAASSTPVSDIQAEMLSVRQKTGRMPNRLVLGADVFKALSNNADIQDRIKHTQRGVVTADLLASLLEFQERGDGDRLRVMVALGSEDTAKEGATGSFSNILDTKDAMLAYAAPRPALMQPSAGYSFVWTGLVGSGEGQRMLRYPEPPHNDVLEVESAFDMHQVASDLGVYFDAAVA